MAPWRDAMAWWTACSLLLCCCTPSAAQVAPPPPVLAAPSPTVASDVQLWTLPDSQCQVSGLPVRPAVLTVPGAERRVRAAVLLHHRQQCVAELVQRVRDV
jgi:hypothetical protein